jgi:hypothetical protein
VVILLANNVTLPQTALCSMDHMENSSRPPYKTF